LRLGTCFEAPGPRLETREIRPSTAAWLIRLRLDDGAHIVGRVVEMSPHSLRVCLNWRPPENLQIGEPYRAEIHPGTPQQFAFTAEVRYVDGHRVGLKPDRLLPFRTGLRW